MIDFRYVWILLGLLVFSVVLWENVRFDENDEMYWDAPGPEFFDQQQDPHIEPQDQEPAKHAAFRHSHDPHHNHDHKHPRPSHVDFSVPGPHPGPCCPHQRYGPPTRIRYYPQV